jgi:WD40 repeat protein
MSELQPKSQTPPPVSESPDPGQAYPVVPLEGQETNVPAPTSLMLPPRVPDHELIRRIGRGAYGEVWLARSVTGAYRAVKIVHRHSFDHDRPFEREFSGILKFEPISRQHDSQVDILHVGRGADCFYYVMELADDQSTGQQINPDIYAPKTLKSEIFQSGKLPFEECVQISLALTTALEHLHSHGLIHRDVKPSNIIFINGVPKLADIGLVTSVGATRSFVGTEGFAPPEGPGTPQADVYSLGKVLYEICTGKDRQDFPELPTDLDTLADREALLELNAVIGKACREDPGARYASAKAMHDELVLLQSGKSLARLRTMERTLAKLKRASMAIAIATVLATVAWFYQSRQTERVRKLAAQNLTLAQQAQAKAEESRRNQLTARENLYAADIGQIQHALATDNFRQARELLHKQIPKPGETDLRGFEWRYLWRQCQSEESFSLPGHQEAANCVIFSPDGRMLASTSRDKTAKIWDLESHRAIATLTDTFDVQSASFSPSGDLLATASGTSVRVWDMKTFQSIRTLPGAVSKARFSAATPYLVTLSTNGLILWSTRTWSVVSTREFSGIAVGPLSQASSSESCIAFSTDGTKVGVVCDEGVALLTVPELQEIEVLKDHSPRSRFVAFSPDCQSLAASTATDKRVKLWALNDKKQTTLLTGHLDTIGAGAFSPDGKRLATASFDQTVKLWDVSSGELLRTFRGHSQEVWDVTFSPDGKLLASVSNDGAVKVWDAVTVPNANSALAGIVPLGFALDGKLVAVTHTNGNLVSFHSGGFIRSTLECPTDGTLIRFDPMLSITPTQQFIGLPVRYDVIFPSPFHSAEIAGLIIRDSDGGSIAEQRLEVWNLRERHMLCSIPGVEYPGMYSHRMFFASPTSLLAASTGNETVSLWHLPEATRIGVLTNTFDAGGLSPNGTILATRRREFSAIVDLWGINDNAVAQVATWDVGGWPEWIEFSPDGLKVALGIEGVIKLLAVPSGRLIETLTGHKRLGFRLRFSPDGRTLAGLTDEGTVRLWHVITGRELMDLPLPIVDGHGICLEFSPDGRNLAACRTDYTGELTQIWFAPSLAEIAAAEAKDDQGKLSAIHGK